MINLKYFFTYILNFLYICGSFVYNPFDNYRKVARHKNPLVALPIWILIAVYFTLSGLFYRKSSFLTILIFSFFLIIFLFVGIISRKKTSLREIFNIWSFSYLPTLLWFFVTFILFLIYPPGESSRLSDYFFSIIYLVFSLLCLYIKIICLFIIFKFVIKLSLLKTIFSMFVVWGIVIFLGVALYRLHFFRIPFI